MIERVTRVEFPSFFFFFPKWILSQRRWLKCNGFCLFLGSYDGDDWIFEDVGNDSFCFIDSIRLVLLERAFLETYVDYKSWKISPILYWL